MGYGLSTKNMIYCIIHPAADTGRWRDSYGSPCGHVAGMTKEEMQMRKQLRRWCSLLLTLVMVVSLLPTAVFADSSGAKATLVTDASTVKVGDKVVIAAKGYDYALRSHADNSPRQGSPPPGRSSL